MTAERTLSQGRRKLGALLFVAASALTIAGCQTSNPENVISIERDQGSESNIASLTQVINNNPRDARAYNVRGSAYGRAGDFSQALKDFDRAIKLNPNFYQAYANRAPDLSRHG